MSIPLLRTKLYIPPPQPGLVHRPRLTQLINEGLNRKLTLISAPAGFGKTTLLSEWILTSQRRVSWFSLEEADNDPTRFWAYFMAALQMLQENLVKDSRAFLQAEGQQTELAQFEPFLTSLLNDISAFPDEFALVLDDYQQIDNQAIHESIVFLIDHLPPRMHLILTCRSDPRIPLARLRARGQMTELRAVDLRFTSEEIVTFLNQSMKLDLSVDQIAALEQHTEGWIAGLQLAAISMQRRTDTSGFIESFTGSHRFILDYLVDEVLNCQPEDIQSFLLETSILERFTGSLCDSVTGLNDGQAMLEQLEQANLFIMPLDDERRWYRYHPLFADLLRSRLQESKPDRKPTLHRRACEWFEREGLLPEAVDHALTASEFEKAAQLIERAAEPLRQQGEIATLTGWMKALPRDIRRNHPALCIAYARALADTAQLKAVQPLLEDAQVGLEKNPSMDDLTRSSLKGQIAALAAYLEITGNRFDQAIELSERARQLLAGDDMRWRSFVALNLAGAYRFTSDWTAASQTYLEASHLSQAAGDKVNALTAISLRGEVLQAQGLLHQSAGQFEQVLELARELAIPTAPVTGYALVGLGRAWCEWNDLEMSSSYVQDGLECGKKGDVQDVLLRGYVVQARIRQAQGELEGALEALKNADLAVRQIGVEGVTDWVNAFRVQVWLARGETDAAIDWASAYSRAMNDTIFPTIAIGLARVRLAQDRPQEALSLLEHARQSAYAVGRLGNAVQIMVVEALVHQAQGSFEQAYSTLSRLLPLAEPEGYLRIFLDEGEPMRLLIANFKSMIANQVPGTVLEERRISIDYLNKILAAFPVPSIPRTLKSIVDNLPSSALEPLSERELEVLHLMAAGLSNRDIARRDVVSINTVKTQVKSIYGKLGAHTRADALMAARQLGLI
jgi:ATP/maltotriose-dependent transcriptional regulator MalT